MMEANAYEIDWHIPIVQRLRSSQNFLLIVYSADESGF